MAAALSDYMIHLPSTHFQTRWAGHSGLLVRGQGEVSQAVGGTLRGPGPDQAPPVLVQHRHKCCQKQREEA